MNTHTYHYHSLTALYCLSYATITILISHLPILFPPPIMHTSHSAQKKPLPTQNPAPPRPIHSNQNCTH